MRFVGVRELRKGTGKVLALVKKGERVVLTMRGKPFAAIAPLKEEEIEKMILQGQGWLKLSESSFDFWNNKDDEVWDEV